MKSYGSYTDSKLTSINIMKTLYLKKKIPNTIYMTFAHDDRFFKSFNLWRSLWMISFCHQTKTLIGFLM